jgi:hypothetical protein
LYLRGLINIGQTEVYDCLKELRKISKRWHTINEVKNYLIGKGYTNGTIKNVANNLLQLSSFNMIDVRGIGLIKHYKVFRAKY